MAKRSRFEIITRTEGEPRPGWVGMSIDGQDADVTVDPAQWMPVELVNSGGDPVKAMAACVARAEEYVERKYQRLLMGRAGRGLHEPGRKRVPQEALFDFMNRGALKGLDETGRRKRLERRANRFDNERDWADRRAKLIAECRAELADAEARLAEIPGDAKLERDVAILKDRLAGLAPRVVAVIHGFQFAYTQYWTAAVNLPTDDIRIWPYMTNTTIDTVRDGVDTFSDVTLDEFDGANYSSGGLALDSQTVAVDDANDRAEFDCADEVVSALGAGTRAMQGVAVGKFNTNTAGSLPLHAIDFSSNKNPDGSDFTFAINAEGLMQMADG